MNQAGCQRAREQGREKEQTAAGRQWELPWVHRAPCYSDGFPGAPPTCAELVVYKQPLDFAWLVGLGFDTGSHPVAL